MVRLGQPHVNRGTGEYWIIDWRIYGGKTRLDHVRELLDDVISL